MCKMGLNDPNDLLRVQRLLYLQRLVVYGPSELWALLQQNARFPRSWFSLVIEDMTWLREFLPKGLNMPPPLDDMDSWIAVCKQGGGHGKSGYRRLGRWQCCAETICKKCVSSMKPL
ncbi:unnamed protein product [Polarella glacialis]|uniref:Uncharacterized protein n=1 Tax=Polarella glacialis TaxID=89957 RepID=A0A813EMK8_POLGL|nr:unnamed protein product [Polarella glacialis]